MPEKNNKKQPLGIPETRGSFQMSGIVSGVQRDSFYSERQTKTNKLRRTLNFAVQFDKDQRQYVELSGMEQKSVWFTKSNGDGANRTVETLEVPWQNRNTYKAPDGYRLIGVKVGLEKTVDDKGVTRNKVMDMPAFDACAYASQHMADDMGVFVRGSISYSTYRDTHRKRFELAQISHMAAPNFDDPNYAPLAQFTQRIVFMGIQPTDDKRYLLSAKIINYNSVEDAEFYVEDRDLALSIRKGMKPYTAVETYGIIRTVKQEEETKTSSSGLYWGKPNPMKTRTAPTKIEMVIIGVQEETIDESIYTEENIANAMRIAKNLRDSKADFGETDSDEVPWGKNTNLNSSTSDDDEDEDW